MWDDWRNWAAHTVGEMSKHCWAINKDTHSQFEHSSTLPKLICAMLFFTLLILSWAQKGEAQSLGSGWSKPELLASTPLGYISDRLWLLRDPQDSLYLWWPVGLANKQAANDEFQTSVYHTKRINGRWSQATDILLWPNGGRLTSVIIDSTGTLHAFSATDCVSYVSARSDKSMQASAWSKRRCIDNTGNSDLFATQGPDGTIYVTYVAPGTQTLRLAKSTDNGITWDISDIAVVQSSEGGFFSNPALAVDNKNRLHAVWSPNAPPSGYPLLGILYARSDDGGIRWTAPLQLGREHEGQAAIVTNENEIHVLWNGDAGKKGRYYRYSNDGGKTWAPIVALTKEGVGGGLQNPPALIVDNVGHVHVLLQDGEALSYMMKGENGWTAREALYAPQSIGAIEIFGVRLAITGGNQLHALYSVQVKDSRVMRIYHQYRTIDARPATPVAGFASALSPTKPAPTQTVVPATPTRQSLAEPSRTNNLSNVEPAMNNSPIFTILTGVIPAALLVVLAIIARLSGRWQ